MLPGRGHIANRKHSGDGRLTQADPNPGPPTLQRRLEKRMGALQRMKLAGFDVGIVELEVELG
jgi:hypothetical protein